ncbi:S8 family serine peptidase [Fictibacillus aquaticus]|nr:S8 family serine peptidase [Fictibacillus aquaticus]
MKNNKKKISKIATYALSSALLLSSLGLSTPAEAASKRNMDSMISQMKEQAASKQQPSKKVDTKKVKQQKLQLQADDIIRVIVEVEGQTPVEYATEKGQLYKDLSASKKQEIGAKVEKQQKSVKDKIKAKGVKFKFKKNFNVAFSGFSGEVTYSDVAKIESIAGVKNVFLANEYNRPEVKPDMTTSHQFIQSKQTWADAGFKGEGMVVSVIDSGVDPSHKDFVLTDNATGDLSESEVNSIVEEGGLKGKFYTEKVPYGYNYYDQNDTVLDLGPDASMHGMHVAGTVAANGDEANGGIKGVAPEAQVLGMKVFSNDPNYPSTWSDIYLAAIDDSIKLGADVLNMSLGSTASFYDERSAEDLAITRAVENGIVCSVSAGNSGHVSSGWDNPFASNPDIGVVGAPGLNTDSIQVAASGNEAFLYQHTATVEGVDGFSSVGYGIDNWTKLAEKNGGKLELVSLGTKLGYPADYAGVDVKGKVVVVPRGALSFYDKTKNAADAGAIGIIVHNATNGFFYENQGGWQVPFMMISKQEGIDLLEAIEAGNTTLHVSEKSKTEDAEMGRMTDFTSWGTTPSLELKPEITAPGGKITSTLNDDQYGQMSGTSMAAPHVAGGAALVQQYLTGDERFGDLTVEERTRLAKVLLMNTAKVIDDVHGQPFSPRRQGAGMMQTFAAVDTPVFFFNEETGEAKVELKDFTSKTIEMSFGAQNISDEDVTYNVNTDVLADTIIQAGGMDYNALTAGDLKDVKISAPETVTVKAGDYASFTVTVDLSDAKIPVLDANGEENGFQELKENMFVEGFVKLEDAEKVQPTLAVPYVGFYGNWDEPEIVDGFKDLGENRFFDLDYLFDGAHDMLENDGDFVGLIPGKEFYAISPNGDEQQENIYPLPSFLRNASEVQYNILDKDGKFLRRVAMEKNVRKSFYDTGSGTPYSFSEKRKWDGTVKGNVVEDGMYYYEIKSVIDYDGADWQSKKIPVVVDNTAPKVNAKFDPESKVVTWETEEAGTGVELYGIFVDGEIVDTVGEDATMYQFTEELPAKAVIDVFAIDYMGNVGGDKAAIGDSDIPLIFLDDNGPAPYGQYNTTEIPVSGYVTDDSGIKKLTVNGEEVEVVEDEAGNLTFSTTAKFDSEGLHDVLISVTDYDNKEFKISRKVFIDTTAAEITVVAPEKVNNDKDEATLKINLKDNFNFFSLFVDDNHEFESTFESPHDVLVEGNETLEVTVPLKDGANTFTLTATDLGGNKTTKTVTVNRVDTEGPALAIYVVSDKSTKVQGATEPGSKVTVMAGGKTLGTAKALSNGRYYVTIPVQKGGTVLTVVAEDAAKNKTTKTVTVKDTTAPNAPTVYYVSTKSVLVQGRTEAGAKAIVRVGSRVIGTATADRYGKFKAPIAKQKKGTVLSVTVQDAAGNTSKATKVTVK